MKTEWTRIGIFSLLGLACVAGTLLSGCMPADSSRLDQAGIPAHALWPDLGLSIQIDPEMPPAEVRLLAQDVSLLSQMQIQTSSTSLYGKIFGGPSQKEALQFIDERINYFVSNTQSIESRIGTAQFNYPTEATQQAVVMASNLGTPLWLFQESIRPERLRFRIGDAQIPVESSRVGIIRLGEGYSEVRNPTIRIGTLVHEARHSDCTGGLAPEDLNLLRREQPPSNPACGHLHVDCPPGHDFAGLPACDSHPWGAYTVELVFANAMARQCSNCRGVVAEDAMAVAVDSASRVLVLNEMLEGKLGDPNMSSSGRRE